MFLGGHRHHHRSDKVKSPPLLKKVFHSCICVLSVLSVFVVVIICDTNVTEKEEYILKQTKVIEAAPRALSSRQNSDSSTALAEGGKPLDPCGDKSSYEAIRTLHRQLDDDASGDIDVTESDEFLRDELKYENGYERHKEFHGDDKSISVDELWEAWKMSLVHNWTVEEAVDWLISSVELVEYEHTFREHAVNGTCLPRLAINSNSLLSGRLGIKDPIHRQKIALKAMDVVLFGAPKKHNYLKDAILAIAILVATGGCWFAFVQHKHSQAHMQKMMKDMELLQRAEDALLDMQKELYKARQEQEIVNIEKQDLERRLQDEMKTGFKAQGKGLSSGSSSDQARLRELEEQLRTAKSSLHDAERRLGSRTWMAPVNLQLWLQLTYELELKNYNKKKSVAEQQLLAAKEGCEKLKKKRSTLLGAFRIAHGGSIDDVDDRIIQAKSALSEVTTDLQERMHRWKQIEKLCGVTIMQNPGLTYLESVLRPPVVNGSTGNLHSGAISLAHSSSEGNLAARDESPPPYAAGLGAAKQLVHASAPMFVVPIRPSWSTVPKKVESLTEKRHHFKHQDSGISLSSNVTIPTNSSVRTGNALLSNIPPPPPTYSRSSPSYSRKPHSYPETVHSSYFSATSSASGFFLPHSASNSCHDILEAAAEEDEQLLEVDEEILVEEKISSLSSFGGYSEAGRPPLLLEDGMNAISSGAAAPLTLNTTESGSRDLLHTTEADRLSSHSESVASESIAASDFGETSAVPKTVSSTPEEKKKKKSTSGIINTLKNSFSSSNLSSMDTCDDDDASTFSADSEHKKKKLFSRFIRKKSKMM